MKNSRPKKSLGQNWLKDPEVLEKIIEAAELSKTDNVLEIGSGTGVLTNVLTNVLTSGKVIAVEKDERLAEKIARNYQLSMVNDQSNSKFQIQDSHSKFQIPNSKFIVIADDILEINLPRLIEDNNFQDYKVVANIPYYITGKIIRLLFETKYTPKLIVLLVQKEVAERICAKPGDMSILAVSVQFFGKPEIIDYVSKESFDPVPKVDSAILRIVPYPVGARHALHLQKDFFRLVKVGFASPRKTLVNNLSSGFQKDKEEIKEALKKVGVEENARAESLSVEDWKKLEQVTG